MVGTRPVRMGVLVIGASGALAAPTSARAATTIGEASGSGTQICTTDWTWVQDATASGSPSYAVPAGGGVITGWSQAVSSDTPMTANMRLKVFRKTGTKTYLTVGHSAVEPLTSPGVKVFATRISVRAGDLLGLRTGGTEGTDCYRTGQSGDVAEQQGLAGEPDPPVGSIFNSTFASTFLLNVAAVVEPDADNDGFGDESQDECLGVGGSVDGCVPSPPADADPPETKITKGAPNRLHRHKVKFKFSSDEPGSTFECKLDRERFKPCESPSKVKNLDEGKHKFKVRAIDAAGNVDPSAAKDKFKVV